MRKKLAPRRRNAKFFLAFSSLSARNSQNLPAFPQNFVVAALIAPLSRLKCPNSAFLLISVFFLQNRSASKTPRSLTSKSIVLLQDILTITNPIHKMHIAQTITYLLSPNWENTIALERYKTIIDQWSLKLDELLENNDLRASTLKSLLSQARVELFKEAAIPENTIFEMNVEDCLIVAPLLLINPILAHHQVHLFNSKIFITNFLYEELKCALNTIYFSM